MFSKLTQCYQLHYLTTYITSVYYIEWSSVNWALLLVENSSISVNHIFSKKPYYFWKSWLQYLKKSHDYLKLYFLDFVIIIYYVIIQQKSSIAFSITFTASIYKPIPLLPSWTSGEMVPLSSSLWKLHKKTSIQVFQYNANT